MLMCWNAVVEKKVSKGVVIKNLLDGEETLFPFDIPKLAIVDSDKMIVDWHIGTPWVAATEKDKVIVGRPLIAFFQSVENKWVPFCAAFRGDFSFRNGDDVFVDPHRRHVVVIYHDFEKEVKKGNSGFAFANAIDAYLKTFSAVAHLVHADGAYEKTVARLKQVAEDAKGMIDTVLIATHGHIGQVWLGSAKDIWANNLCAWVLGAADEGKGFASPGAFGTLLKNLFGTRLAIGIYACNFADAPGGDTVAMEIRGAAEARVLVAGKADVYFKIPASGQRPVAECNGAVAFYTEKTIEIGSRQIPIFPI